MRHREPITLLIIYNAIIIICIESSKKKKCIFFSSFNGLFILGFFPRVTRYPNKLNILMHAIVHENIIIIYYYDTTTTRDA